MVLSQSNHSFRRSYYERPATDVARCLLGATLCRLVGDTLLTAKIVETECYSGLSDLASHGRSGQTPRNLPMWEDSGHAYIYRSYGIHWMLNLVTEPAGQPAAVLIRALEPLSGLKIMQALRPERSLLELTNGPGRLCQALAITGADNRNDLTEPTSGLFIKGGEEIDDQAVRTGPRVGIGTALEPWFSMPWRYWIAGNPFVSLRAGQIS